MIIQISGKNASLYIENIGLEYSLKFKVIFTKRAAVYPDEFEERIKKSLGTYIILDSNLDPIWSNKKNTKDGKIHIEAHNVPIGELLNFLDIKVGVAATSDILNFISKMKQIQMLVDGTDL